MRMNDLPLPLMCRNFLCVFRDAIGGGVLRGLAQVSLMLEVPFPSSWNSLLPDP